jgi:predicted Fe-Mo cluster-binding NifX family protein
MKVAITSSGNTLNSNLDKRFGRCSFFAVYDTEKKKVEFIANPNKGAEEGAGPASVQFIASVPVTKIVSGEFGFKIKSLLVDLKIQMIVVKEPNKTVADIIKLLNH